MTSPTLTVMAGHALPEALRRWLNQKIVGQDRPDRHILLPVLASMLSGAVNDFEKYHDVAHARQRVRDHALLETFEAERQAAKATP